MQDIQGLLELAKQDKLPVLKSQLLLPSGFVVTHLNCQVRSSVKLLAYAQKQAATGVVDAPDFMGGRFVVGTTWGRIAAREREDLQFLALLFGGSEG